MIGGVAMVIVVLVMSLRQNDSSIQPDATVAPDVKVATDAPTVTNLAGDSLKLFTLTEQDDETILHLTNDLEDFFGIVTREHDVTPEDLEYLADLKDVYSEGDAKATGAVLLDILADISPTLKRIEQGVPLPPSEYDAIRAQLDRVRRIRFSARSVEILEKYKPKLGRHSYSSLFKGMSPQDVAEVLGHRYDYEDSLVGGTRYRTATWKDQHGTSIVITFVGSGRGYELYSMQRFSP